MLSQERKIKMASKRVKQSIILSVSVMKGCYRHIQVSVNEDLEALADIILWAFDFDNDHAHAFFMDNKAWSNYDCYYMAEVDEDEMYRHTCDFKLHQLGLTKGKAFKFVFDFGDDWEFNCKVLRIVYEDTKDAELIRAVGEPPEQYPDYDDFEDDE